MSVSAGDKVGPYEILVPIGAGGMGEVWKARDTRLNREVAIKFSQAQFSDRFQREAHAIASLNHSNICTLFDVGPNYIVMELIEGPTLADRIKEGPIPLDEALRIARQIGDALEAAHEKGIVHRDLKPGNIKIRPDGSVKVLDFGLAKSAATETAVTSDSPTVMHSPTLVGVILGTAAYMAPEQARGKTVDKRADIWAFGVVLYEMLTGKRLFEGEDLTDTLASVVKSEPNLTPVPRKTRRLLAMCLEKDPKKRLRDIGDLHLLLEEQPQIAKPRRVLTPWIAAAAASLAAVGIAAVHLREKPVQQPVPATFQFEQPSSLYTMLAVSPNGRYIAMSSRTARVPLVIRPVGGLEMRRIQGTEGAQDPFWSPDSAWVGFSADGKLKKVEITGGAPQTICDGGGVASWGDGYILFGGSRGMIRRVPATGGAAVPIKLVGAAGTARVNQVLPDGRHFLYTLIADQNEAAGAADAGRSRPPVFFG